jgi:hypothetical protein
MPPFDEASLKHVEFVQNVITRMNSNSFQLKGWAVALTAGLFALSDKSNPEFAFLAFAPIVMIWILDAYYLRTERQYRNLYAHLCAKANDPTYATSLHYSLNLDDYPNEVKTKGTKGVAFSKTQLGFYVPLLVSVVLVVLALKYLVPLLAPAPAAPQVTPAASLHRLCRVGLGQRS